MTHACTLDAHVIAVAHFILVVTAEFFAQKGRDVIRLDGMNGGADQLAVDALQVCLSAKNDVGGIFRRFQAPVIGFFDLLQNRTIALGEFVQLAVQPCRIPSIGQLLRFLKIVNGGERVVQQPILRRSSWRASQLCPLQ